MVRLIDALLRLKLPAFQSLFFGMQGFYVLASQLRHHPPTDELFNASCDLFTGQSQDVYQEEVFDIDTTGYTMSEQISEYKGQPDAAVVSLN